MPSNRSPTKKNNSLNKSMAGSKYLNTVYKYFMNSFNIFKNSKKTTHIYQTALINTQIASPTASMLIIEKSYTSINLSFTTSVISTKTLIIYWTLIEIYYAI